MDAGLSAVFDPLQLAKQGKRLTGHLALQNLPRLAALSSKPASGKVELDLHFSRGEDQQNRVTGKIGACFAVICQRCLEPMTLKLSSEVDVLLIDGHENAADHSDGIVCNGKMSAAELIEDDLLLAVPMFPKHRAGGCQLKSELLKQASVNKEQKGDRRENPFAVLAALKLDKKSEQKKD